MLCQIETRFHTLLPNDIDEVLRNEDRLYRTTASVLQAKGELDLESPAFLEIEQLPTTITVDKCTYNIYENAFTGRIASTPGSIFEPLDVLLQQAFLDYTKNILVLDTSYMMAMYKDRSDRNLFSLNM